MNIMSIENEYRAYIQYINKQRHAKGLHPIKVKLYKNKKEASEGIECQYDIPHLDVKGVRSVSGNRVEGGWAVRTYIA
jgi:hypothetical protein